MTHHATTSTDQDPSTVSNDPSTESKPILTGAAIGGRRGPLGWYRGPDPDAYQEGQR